MFDDKCRLAIPSLCRLCGATQKMDIGAEEEDTAQMQFPGLNDSL
jgi:hypothetical protein